jgi:acetolactate synthase-1/2/3 large subunit
VNDLHTHTTARALLEGLQECGIHWLFCNLGTDHVTLIDEWAQAEQEGRPMPQVLSCPHENVAIHMAGGYAAITGQGQGVLVHVDAGTANATMGLHNLLRARLPVLLMAGKAPFALHGELPGARDNYVHYVQDPFDIASLVRPYVRWEYNLPSGHVTKEVVRRAHSIMHNEPPGPVYLTLPREVLAQELAADSFKSYPADRYGFGRAGALPDEWVNRFTEELMQARQPLIVTAYLGRHVQAVSALEELAELCGIAVVAHNPHHVCISPEHEWFAGFDAAPWLPDTDLGVLIDVDVPWLPQAGAPAQNSRWAHIDVDPLKTDFPMWGFAAHWRQQADAGTALRQIIRAVRARADDAFTQRVARRRVAMAEKRQQRLSLLQKQAHASGEPGALNPAWVCAQIHAMLDAQDVVVNEGIRNSMNVLQHMPRTRPGTLIGAAGGGLGYSASMALGAALALREQGSTARVVHIEGDGGFHFSNPTAVYSVAQQYQLPILSVVLDNSGWQAVKDAVSRMHPHGAAVEHNQFFSKLNAEPRRFDQVASAFGAHGECVTQASELVPALQRCLQAMSKGQASVLSVKLAPV